MDKQEIKNEFIREISTADIDELEIRRLTPREAFRLQGLREEDIDKLMNSGISHTDLYKLAGNSIAIPCLQHIFHNMITDNNDIKKKNVSVENLDIVQIGNLIESKCGRKNHSPYRVYSTKGVSPTLMASMGCGGRSPLVAIKNGKYL